MRSTVAILTILPALCVALEPFTTVYVAGTAMSSLAGYLYYKYYSCEQNECCSEPWIHPSPQIDFSDLHGQPLVIQLVTDLIKRRKHISKPLTLSFHGPTGTGKTFFSSILSKMIFKKGVDSQYVHFFTNSYHFSNPSKEWEYHDSLKEIIMSNLTKCEKSVFIFDEFHLMPHAVVSAVVSFLEPRGLIGKVSTGQATFIFLSNTGSKAIINTSYQLWQNGVHRHDYKLSHFEDVIKLAVYNEIGSLKDSDLVKKELIDAYVPFLPLKKKHVETCIKNQFYNFHNRSATEKEVSEILADISFRPEQNYLYAETGCKKVLPLVARY